MFYFLFYCAKFYSLELKYFAAVHKNFSYSVHTCSNVQQQAIISIQQACHSEAVRPKNLVESRHFGKL